MYHRNITKTLAYVAQKFPVVTLTGPRQSGKTTLVRNFFSDKQYVSLENLDSRSFAKEDPRGFLNTYNKGVIIDEAQEVPELFSYMQEHVDKDQIMGEFILTGSQHFLLSKNISQSLAGRAAVLQLLPCTLKELSQSSLSAMPSALFKGFYPAVYDRDIDPTMYYKSYINTYIECDLRTISAIKDLSKFKTFLSLCAGRIGQLLNMSSIGNDCGIDQETVKAWLSILEASYIIILLKPHHQNFNKRLTKQPKLYFCDTGLASYLLGIETAETIKTHYAKGVLFENYVLIELLKKRFNEGKDSNLYFWRDYQGHEVDFIQEVGQTLTPIEVKSTETINSSLFDGLKYWQELSTLQGGLLVYGGSEAQKRSSVSVLPWFDIDSIGS